MKLPPLNNYLKFLFGVCLPFLMALPLRAQTVAETQPGVTVIAADEGAYGGSSMGTTHQNTESYWIEKKLTVPAESLQKAHEARLRVYLGLLDNSHKNGMDEAFELVINGKPFLYQTNDPTLPSGLSRVPRRKWHDFMIPVSALKAGINSFIFHKTASDKNDDYLYIGIDASVDYGLSRCSLDGGKTWQTKSLNTIGATGEYMIRLLLLDQSPQAAAAWTPQQTTDPHQIIGYVENKPQQLKFEFDQYQIDAAQPMKIDITYHGAAPAVRFMDGSGKSQTGKVTREKGRIHLEIAPQESPPKGLEIQSAKDAKVDISEVKFAYSQPVGNVAQRVDMAPKVLLPKGKALARKPQIIRDAKGFTLQNSTLQARFETTPHLRLASLRNEYLQKNVLRYPDKTKLFLIESHGHRFAAADWKVEFVKVLSPTEIAVHLALADQALKAQFTIGINETGLRLGLRITNASSTVQSWKTAFPQIGGIQLSEQAKGDYYLFPQWGGVIANANVNFKSVYGAGSAWWQMVDVFSPSGGAGLSLRSADETGLYKGIDMRKGENVVPGGALLSDYRSTSVGGYLADDMGWQNTLDAAPGTSMAFEYIKYTRQPQKYFSPPDAIIEMHPGDWHNAMQTYADWAHRVWKWQPILESEKDIWNTIAVGWSNASTLYKSDGTWRTDFRTIDTLDSVELMSWWQWAEKGPWQVPMNELEAAFGETGKRYSERINPATGKPGWAFNRGDYYYNTDWGGLPALRDYLQQLRDKGLSPTFYTDPLLADANTDLARKHGMEYGVMNPRWKGGGTYSSAKYTPKGYVGDYYSFNMCIDNQWYQDFVVDQMTRIAHDTGVDGIRLDQIANRGFVCTNPHHQHLYAEPGHNAWMQAAEPLCRRIQENVKKFNPQFMLQSEYFGNDYLASTLNGYIEYESERHVSPAFRPVPLNVARFYFPENKPYDLDTSKRAHGEEWRFWNATASGLAGAGQHPPLYYRVLKENSDAFGGANVKPLIPSLAQGIYINQFASGQKTIYLFYNARGFTVDGDVLQITPDNKYHYFDVLHGKEITPRNNAIALKIAADEVAAIARLPKVLSVQKDGIHLDRAVKDATLVLCDAEGAHLKTIPVNGTKVLLPENKAVCVKLFEGKYLVDAVELS